MDIVGAALIWRFGLPERVSREGHSAILQEGIDQGEKQKAWRYDRLSEVGLALLIVGFAVQLVSNWI